ncbi:SAGA-associated factor 11 homolog [Phymastichus coffea]|uniref:SAGA-associated factor 11 homolog n=1 Tax=Phymastichus coffea TaxID=108790 RepID=UPI00273A9544|nr:SAGA-associated factor 11 homolog [Phymastichus coffea]
MAYSQSKVDEIEKRFQQFMLCEEAVEKEKEAIYESLLDEVLMGFVFDSHRNAKLGIDDAEEGIPDGNFDSIDVPGLDFLGNPRKVPQVKCTCPNCERDVGANYFARHMENCFGLGRNSARTASRRSTTTVKYTESETVSDDDVDDDWGKSKKRKRKSSKNPTKKRK